MSSNIRHNSKNHILILGLWSDGYDVAYKPIILLCISFRFIEIKFIHCHSCVMFVMNSMSIYTDEVNYDEMIT